MNDPYVRIEQAIAFIRSHAHRQPQLAEVAAAVGLSPYHFQRLFREWAGISPKRYLEFLTVARAKRLLGDSLSVLQAAHEVGLSGPSRLHEQFVSVEAASPGEYKSGGHGLEIAYGIHDTRFGGVLVAQTQRGVCLLSFVEGYGKDHELARMRRLYPRARFVAAPTATAATAEHVFAAAGDAAQPFHLSVRGTNLQVQVWRALLQIPAGCTTSYQELARRLGRPRAVRAIASAVGANPVNYLIPCHRVLRANGELGGFRGGTQLKGRLLASERAPAAAADEREPAQGLRLR